MTERRAGDSTRAAHAGLPARADGEPFLPGPTFAAPYHLAGPADASRFNYGRYDNPTWARLEDALGELEGAESVVFASGMAAVSAVVIPGLHTGDVLVAPADAYPGIRTIARDVLEPNGVEVRLVPTADDAVREALPGATLVWLESPSNPGLDVLDLRALCAEAHAAGATVAVDNTLAGPLRQRPLELGADYSVMSASKYLGGHSDLILGTVAVADDAARGGAARVADRDGLDPGAVRGVARAPLAGHAGPAPRAPGGQRPRARRRCCAPATTSATCAGPASARSSASTWARTPAPTPSWAPVPWWRSPRASAACTPTPSAARAGAATPSTDGFVRLNAGIEDAPDLLADVERALELSRP